MKPFTCAILGLVIAAGVLFSTGCASDTTTTRSRDLPGQNRYSSMPQNLPQQWEGQGMLGGMAGYQ